MEVVQDMANSMQSCNTSLLDLGVDLQTFFFLLTLYKSTCESEVLGHQSKLRVLDRGAVGYLITGHGI